MSRKPQNPGGDVVTFVLDFCPDRRRWREVDKALAEIGPDLVKACTGFFEHWHASRHCVDWQHNQLWFRFKSSQSMMAHLIEKAKAVLQGASGKYGFCLNPEIVEPEVKAFGQGDPRPENDVVKMIGGPQNLPQLWREIQEATELAIADLAAHPHRSLPSQWLEEWSVHIYGNCLGRE
jgi:hypothetical protein